MSIFSTLGSAVSKVASGIANAAKGAYNYFTGSSGSSGYNSGNNNYLAGIGAAPIFNPGNTSISVGSRASSSSGVSGSTAPTTISAGSNPIPSYATYAPSMGTTAYGPQLPVNINAGKQPVLNLGNFSQNVADYIAKNSVPTTLSVSSLGGNSGDTSAPLAKTQITLDNAPKSAGVDQVDMTKIAGLVSDNYTYNPVSRTYDQNQPLNNTGSIDTALKTRMDLYDKYLGKRPSVYEDPEVIAAREARNKSKQALVAPMQELNAIVAQQNQDLLSLRNTGAKEGVTEAVYGQQANAINYNAALRALPLQASISAIQGNLKLAQESLDELLKIKTDQINTQYEYNKSRLASIEDYLDKSEQRTYEQLKTANERAYNEAKDLEKYKAELSLKVIQNNPGVSATTLSNINNAKSMAEAAKNAGLNMTNTTVSSSPLVNAILNVNAGAAEGQQKRDAQQVTKYIASGQLKEARQFILSRVTAKMSSAEREAELDRRNTIDALTEMKQALNEYASTPGADTNLITGGIEDIANTLGRTSDPKLAAIKTRIIQSTQKYRNAITGAAWGEQEDKEYKAIFPSISNTKKLNTTIIDTMIPLLKNNERNAIGLFLGGSDLYDTIFSDPLGLGTSQSGSFNPLSI